MAQNPSAPGADPPPARRLVVGYDHHAPSVSALRVAMSMATALDASLHVIHVVDLDDAYANIDDPDWESLTQGTVDAERDVAQHMLEAFAGHWTYETRRGQAAEVLARTATLEEALMIVIGERRTLHGAALVHLLERSVLHRLLHVHPATPVLVVPDHATDRPTGSAAPTRARPAPRRITD